MLIKAACSPSLVFGRGEQIGAGSEFSVQADLIFMSV